MITTFSSTILIRAVLSRVKIKKNSIIWCLTHHITYYVLKTVDALLSFIVTLFSYITYSFSPLYNLSPLSILRLSSPLSLWRDHQKLPISVTRWRTHHYPQLRPCGMCYFISDCWLQYVEIEMFIKCWQSFKNL